MADHGDGTAQRGTAGQPFQRTDGRHEAGAGETGEDRTERALPLRQREEVQKVLREVICDAKGVLILRGDMTEKLTGYIFEDEHHSGLIPAGC